MKERVKFYSENDLCYGMHLEKIETCIIPKFESIDINDAIEYYQIKQYFDDGGCPEKWSKEQYEEYFQKQKNLFSLAMRFFNSLCDDNIVTEYEKIDIDYKEAFWELFDNCKLFDKVCARVFRELIHTKHISPYHIMTKKNIVVKYGNVLKEYIKQNIFMARVLVDVYEQDYKADCKKLYLPEELKNEEICECIRIYITSNEANFNVLDSIFRMKKTDRFPISDEIRLMALERYEEKKKEIIETGTKILHGVRLICSEEQKEPKKFEMIGSNSVATYSVRWLLETLDYPSILNNFLYLFEYADIPQMRCNLVSKKANASVFEDIFGEKKLSCYYSKNDAFNTINMLAQLQMEMYYHFLSNQGIRYEDVLNYFFTQYLQEEFNCSEIKVLFPSEGTTYFEKCTILCTAFDSLLKQYSIYIKHKEINIKLVSISSNSVKFNNIDSLVDEKYIYGCGKEFDWLKFALFSSQCSFSHVERIYKEKRSYDTFYELLKNEDVYLSDYRKIEESAFLLLAEKELITISNDGKLSLGDELKLNILYDIYKNEVISKYHYSLRSQEVFEQWIKQGLLRSKGGLFSEPEVDYLNYILNHSEYVNGLDLRNKYSHGVQVGLDDVAHKQNYFLFLIMLTILAIKINDDFIIKELVEKSNNKK